MEKKNYFLMEWVLGSLAGACLILFSAIASGSGIFSSEATNDWIKITALLFLASAITIGINLMITGSIYKTHENPEEDFKDYQSFYIISAMTSILSASFGLVFMLASFFYADSGDLSTKSTTPIIVFATVICIAVIPLIFWILGKKKRNKASSYNVTIQSSNEKEYLVKVEEDQSSAIQVS